MRHTKKKKKKNYRARVVFSLLRQDIVFEDE
jgi:hypothetical protein